MSKELLDIVIRHVVHYYYISECLLLWAHSNDILCTSELFLHNSVGEGQGQGNRGVSLK